MPEPEKCEPLPDPIAAVAPEANSSAEASRHDASQESPPPQEPFAGPDAGARVFASIERMGTQLEELVSTVRGRLSYDETKEQAFERLYAELDALKRNAAIDNIKPLLLDLILLYDRMEQSREQAAAEQELVPVETLQSFIDELLEVLFRRDVGLIEPGSPSFDYNQQKAVGVVDATDPAEHQRVDRVVRRGFRLGDRILRAEEVIVRRLMPPPSGGPTNDGRDEQKEKSP